MEFLFNINAAHILVAESNADNMSLISTILEDAGYNVQRAYYAGDALYAIEHGEFDLAILDTNMKDQTDRPLIDSVVLQPRYTNINWIALVSPDSKEPGHLLRQGAAAYVLWPSSPDELLRQIENVLQGHTMTPLPVEEPAIAPRPSGNGSPDDIRKLLERRLVEQQTLSALARSLSAVLDLDVLLTEIVDAAVRLTGAEEGLLLLPDEEEQALYVRAVKGIDSETARNFRIKTQDTLAGQVFQTGKPLLIGDQGWQKIKTEYLVKSLLYVSLSIKGTHIGVLGVNNKTSERTFSKHDMELLQDLAAHAAVAIENAQLYEDVVLRTRELSTLFQAGKAANSTLAIDQVLSIIAEQLIGALNVNQCYVGEWNPDDGQLDTLAVSYRALWNLGEGPTVTATTNRAITQALENQRLTVLNAVSEEAGHPLAAWLPHHFRAQSIVYIPLFVQKQCLGLVTLYYIHAQYSEHNPLQTTRVQQLALEMALRITSSNTQQKSSLRTAMQILNITAADWCDIALWHPAQNTFYTVVSCGEGIWPETPKLSLELERFPDLTRLLTGETAFVDTASPTLYHLSEAAHAKSFLGIPLVIKGATAGLVLLLDTINQRRFSQRQIDLAQALVLQAANALDNAQLYRDLELSLEELHQTQARLVETARLSAMGELAAAVAHQINNPLTTVLGDTELILQDLPPDDLNAEALQAIWRAGKRAHEVVRRLLAMARSYSVDEILEPQNVNDTINNTLMLVKSHIQQGNVTLLVQLSNDIPPVNGIQGQLEDVWLNLLLNARDAVIGRPEPTIGISTSYQPDQAPGYATIVVWDNGAGIPEDTRPQVFEPFFTTKPVGEGTGLGLHICKQIVEKCEGSISLQSLYNEGTRFIIHLPIFHR
ncbi:MAG: GAF domain-containing protein [Anaerolineae bacterium]|nr:GAF domain-containing protein [Anaerolineae bacterium]